MKQWFDKPHEHFASEVNHLLMFANLVEISFFAVLPKGQIPMKRRLFLAAMVVAVGSILGCDKKQLDKQPSAERELLLFCGAGLQLPVAELAATFARENDIRVVPDYAGAEVLLSRIKLYNQGDLYMPGDREFVCRAAEAGLILCQKSVCYFVPTILVQKGNPKKISSLHDLIKSGVKLGMGNPRTLPVGRIAKEIFEKNKISWAHVEKNLTFQSATVNVLGMQIQARSLDAVVVWDAVARYYSKWGDEVPIPIEKNLISTVDVGVLNFTKNQELAERFAGFLTSEKGRAIFAKHNYTTKKPE